MIKFISSLLLLSMVHVSLNAGSILYFNDLSVGTDRMGQALGDLAGTHTTTTAISLAEFSTEIATGNYDLGILMFQNSLGSDYAGAVNALNAFTDSGGKGIFTDWNRDAAYAALFGVTWGGQNETEITVTDSSLAAGIVNPINLYNPGWGVFSMDISGGYEAAHFASGDGAIAVSQNTIVNGFLTDTFVNGNQGVQLFKNEIGYQLDQSVPDGGATIGLLGLALVGFVGFKRKI
jgi:hypothetical protein